MSRGCGGCYAERIAARFSGPGQPYEGLATHVPQDERTRHTHTPARWTGEVRLVPEMLDQPLRWARPRRVFVNSMSDLFHERLLFSEIGGVFDRMECASQHTFQVLTKRPERMRAFAEWQRDRGFGMPQNVWLGVSAEDDGALCARLPFLLDTAAAVRFVSLEPLLEPVVLAPWLERRVRPDWIIIGGESGPAARPLNVPHVRDLVHQCQRAGVPVFVKQLGTVWARSQGAPGAASDPSEWPDEALRVQQFPKEAPR